MAQHDGSFLSSLSVEFDEDMEGVVCEQQAYTAVISFDNPANTKTSTSVDSFGKSPAEEAAYWSFSKKRHGSSDSATTQELAIKKKSTEYREATVTAHENKTLLDEDSLEELGITGFVDYDDDSVCNSTEVVDIYPTPSPIERFTINKKFKIDQVLHNAEITKNRAITVFDSPEDNRRGWSELGLRIKKPLRQDPSNIRTTGEGYFNFLADELVLNIFKGMRKCALVKCATVCKRWRRLAYDESLWKRLDLAGCIIQAGILGNSILDRGCEYLRMSSTEVIGNVHVKKLFNTCKLQYLDLSMATITTETLNGLIGRCKHLRKLSLENLSVDEQTFRLLGLNPSLTTLNCSMVSGLTDSALQIVFIRCKLLDELNIAWTRLPNIQVQSVIASLPSQILRLNFAGCRENMTDTDVEFMVAACPNLIDLDLSDSLGITENSLESIQKGLTDLEALHVSRCYYITPEGFRCLVSLPSLRYLNIHSMMQENDLRLVMRWLPSIHINTQFFSNTARPTTGVNRTSIWGYRVRDIPV